MNERSKARAKRYPANWKEISRRIRFERAGGRCECEGECGLHRTGLGSGRPGPRRCVERDGQPALWAKGIVRLTVAHLCHDESCADETHMKAMCNRCHLRYDVPLHVAHSRETRDAKNPQKRLFA